MFLEVSLVRHGFITADQFVQAVEYQLAQRPRLGRLALESRKLTMKQVFAVLTRQTEQDKPFGETAVELGYLTTRQVNSLLKQQAQRTLPLAQCLVEIGAIDPETLERISRRLRHAQTDPGRHDATRAGRHPGLPSAGVAEETELATC